MHPRKFVEVRDPVRLHALILASDYSYARLARYAGLRSRQFVHALATGARPRCSPRTAKLIAEALEVPVDELFVAEMSPVRGRNTATHRTGRAA